MKKKRMWPALLLAPLALALVFAVLFLEGGFYPFGDKTVSWCDMNQQVVPLLAEFKDILEGKSGFFLSHYNAGGMNFWGVFFFFLASPFSFLVYWVEKEQLLLFMNVLTVLKLMASALTAAWYFARQARRDGRSIWLVLLLSLSYAFCTYGLMYYQNSIWLDEMVLFPLLLISLEELTYKRKVLPYVLVISAAVIVNYYIGFMVALFVLFRMGCFFLIEPHKKKAHIARSFFWGSVLALGLTAVVWLPSLMQYLGSARTVGILEKLASVGLTAKLTTTLPTVFSLSAVAAMLLGCLIFRVRYPLKRLGEPICFGLLMIPLLLEPVNCVWHAGSYMSFPSRYAFMTVLLGLTVLYRCLAAAEKAEAEERAEAEAQCLEKQLLPPWARILIGAAVLGLVGFYCYFLKGFYADNVTGLNSYARTLWGDEGSLAGLFVAFILATAAYFVIYMVYRFGISRALALFLAGAVLTSDSIFAVKVYMLSVDRSSDWFISYEQLEGELPAEQSFFRIKSADHITYENMEGTLGFPAAAHYTSLNSEDWLFLMKRLGYSSYWMKTSSYGGTSFSDALLSMKYQVDFASRYDTSYYRNQRYELTDSGHFLPLGLLTEGSLPEIGEGGYMGRIPYQEALFEGLFPGKGKLFEKYRPNQTVHADFTEQGDGAVIGNTGADCSLSYTVRIRGTRTLYLDVFSDYTNRLKEPILESFSVKVNGRTASSFFPTQEYNGLLNLGTFSDCEVTVVLKPLYAVGKSRAYKSFGLYGLDEELLAACEALPPALSLKAVSNGYEGSYISDREQTCFLAIPYDAGYTILADGHLLDYERAAEGFVSFTLPAGRGRLAVRYQPPGLKLGALISAAFLLAGLIAALIRKFGKKKKPAGIALFLCKLSFPLLIAAVYLFPLIWSLCHY